MSSSLSAQATWTPPQLSRNEAQAHTAIAQRAMGLPLRCAGTDWRARLRPIFQPPWPTTADDTFTSIEWAGAQMQLQLPAAATAQLMSALLDGAAVPHLPGEMHTAALEAALDEVLGGLQRLGRGAPQVTDISGNPPAAALPHAFAWQLSAVEGNPALAGILRCDSLGLLLMAGLVASLPPHEGPLAHSEALPLHLLLEIGHATLHTEELQHLAPGDVLPLERHFLTAERVLWLQAPGAGGLHVQLPPTPAPAPIERDENATGSENAPADGPPSLSACAPFLTVVQTWTHTMPAHENPPNEAASFDAIPVHLSFDLGAISMTLSELRALQPGQAIPLGHPVAGAVRIRANGALIGEGELVEIDGQLGICVSQLFAATPKPAP